MQFINLTKCIAQNATQFQQSECVAKEPIFTIGLIVIYSFIFLIWFIFGLALKVNKNRLLIGQGNYWITIIAVLISIILWILQIM